MEKYDRAFLMASVCAPFFASPTSLLVTRLCPQPTGRHAMSLIHTFTWAIASEVVPFSDWVVRTSAESSSNPQLPIPKTAFIASTICCGLYPEYPEYVSTLMFPGSPSWRILLTALIFSSTVLADSTCCFVCSVILFHLLSQA